MTRLSAILLYCINTLPIIYEKDHIRLLSIYFCSIINLFNYKIAETYCIKSPPDKTGDFYLYTPPHTPAPKGEPTHRLNIIKPPVSR
jgi:hypothetical protein